MAYKYLTLITLLLLTTGLFSQDLSDTTKVNEVILIAENAPEFPGGLNELFKFIGNNLKYPKDARRNKIQGKVLVSFVVERDGSIKPENIKVEEAVYPSLDLEAVRVIRLLPKWIPASHKGRTVKSKTALRINFTL